MLNNYTFNARELPLAGQFYMWDTSYSGCKVWSWKVAFAMWLWRAKTEPYSKESFIARGRSKPELHPFFLHEWIWTRCEVPWIKLFYRLDWSFLGGEYACTVCHRDCITCQKRLFNVPIFCLHDMKRQKRNKFLIICLYEVHTYCGWGW